jgi:hypothetical protein
MSEAFQNMDLAGGRSMVPGQSTTTGWWSSRHPLGRESPGSSAGATTWLSGAPARTGGGAEGPADRRIGRIGGPKADSG